MENLATTLLTLEDLPAIKPYLKEFSSLRATAWSSSSHYAQQDEHLRRRSLPTG
jgi:hypothetical protein